VRCALVIAAALAWASPADACSCVKLTDAQALAQAAVVVEGKVTLASQQTKRGSITVTKSLKGSKADEVIEFHWETGASMCPTVELKPGTWRLYLLKTNEGLSLGVCDFNSRPLK